ncbi:putative RNA-binding protein 4 [Trypanosoma theileri]|uniref:Putative RNA-binding protein 4 n=1 Tax=Trypanosoma theileri TaxID=67003 RepID=A0A1X0P623_9TRYP|nr:putative RNA-binding protein 4 [Trypanosoma theileri]ORC92386.1 putative RNA-binding protein 4 [Trypanosoma theileri]
MNANLFLTQQQQQQQLGRSPGYFVQLGALNAAPSTAAPCFLSGAPVPPTQQQISIQEQQEHAIATQPGFIITNNNNNNNNSDTGDVKSSQTSMFPLISSSIWATQDTATSFIPAYQCSNTENVVNGNNSSTGVNCFFTFNNGPSTAVEASASPVVYSFPVQQPPPPPQQQQQQQQQEAASGPDTAAAGSTYMILTAAAGNAPNASNTPLYFLVNASTTPSVQPQLTTFVSNPVVQSVPNATTTNTTANTATMNRSEPLPPYPLSQPTANVMGIPWTTQFVPNTGSVPVSGFPLLMSNPPATHVDGSILSDARSFPHQQCYRQQQQQQQQQQEATSQQQQKQQHSFYMGEASNQSTSSASSPASGTRRRTRAGDSTAVRDGSNRNGGGSGQDAEVRAGVPYSLDPVPIDISKTQLIVNFLPQSLTDEEFRSLFARFGPLHTKPTKIIYDQSSRRRKGFGFVYYKDGRSTEGAIKEMNGFLVGGRKLKVRYADQQRSSIDCDSCNGDSVETPSSNSNDVNINVKEYVDIDVDDVNSQDDMLLITQAMSLDDDD